MLLFSFTTALVVASLCALSFTVVCVGLGLAVLVPVLVVTTALGIGVWGWAWVGWYVLRWVGLVERGGLGEGGKQGESEGVGVVGKREVMEVGEKKEDKENGY